MALPQHIGDRFQIIPIVLRDSTPVPVSRAVERNENFTEVRFIVDTGIAYVGDSKNQVIRLTNSAPTFPFPISRIGDFWVRGSANQTVYVIAVRTTFQGKFSTPPGP